ncbi:2-phospho-L-lactate transferase [Sphingobium phenoxybenzoativorans]|uniref:2-phospho-L-lactate transferase n=1 Tax=Sphingobium phenoxybenzoativorans TaxID=1592790 RepID=A0A975KBX3_9SPHN|nr:2-phospho-L-lactate transferase [Sphingobium phenoxybenzoativorans]QUT07177.1 2-phospho-L-lactate transferase [Sphingobium phenoxybenzoativorans]
MSGRVVVLTGGVGGAKLVLGLCNLVAESDVTVIVNTGDDFTHLGLAVSPDIDTLLYTLSGKANTHQGWGRADEGWRFMEALSSLGGEHWFRLGDGDLALHVLRTQRLGRGEPLSTIITDFASAWGIGAIILPMTDQRVATRIDTDAGLLDFQDYFVRRRCEPAVRAIRFDGAPVASAAPGVVDAIMNNGCRAILIAPSNPYLSIDPILAVPQIRAALAAARAPVIAVSPIVGGNAVKGPTAKIMRELGLDIGPTAIVHHYEGVIDGLLVDERDMPVRLDIPSACADTLMTNLDDRICVARAALDLADALR